MPDPEEVKALHDRQEMRAEAFRQAVQRLVVEMPTDHLITFSKLVSGGLSIEIAQYLAGMADSQLLWVRKVCPRCGTGESEMHECTERRADA